MLCHLPTRPMVSGSTHSMRRSVSPPARRERAMVSISLNPIDGPAARTTDLMEAVIFSTWICCHLSPFLKLEIGILLVAPWCRRYATQRLMDTNGHPWVWPVRPCPVNPPLTPFFWVVNRRLTKSACEKMALGAGRVL